MEIEPGCIVRSNAGRDQGRFYIVLGKEKERLLIADGSLRKLEKPKGKNPRHLKKTNQKVDLQTADTNKKIRRLLRCYQNTKASSSNREV